MGRVTPTCVALVLCEAIARSTAGGEASVLRAFEFFEASMLPCLTDPFTVWMQLRNGNGPADMVLVIEHVPPGELETVEIISVKFGLHFTNPNEVVEHEAVFDKGLVFESEGRHRLRLMASGSAIMERDFAVLRTEP
jgi:hypothetical protein